MPTGYLKDGRPVGLYNLGKIRSPGPTEPVSMLDIAWAAGIYEGEGHVQYYRGNRKSKYTTLTEGATVTQKDCWILERLKAKFGGRINIKRASGLYGGECHTWKISGARARGFFMLRVDKNK